MTGVSSERAGQYASARGVLGPVLALKLKYVLDRIGRVYAQEIPERPDGPRYVLYRGELGRIVRPGAANDRRVKGGGRRRLWV